MFKSASNLRRRLTAGALSTIMNHTAAVSLSSFSPSTTTLTPACNAVYTSTIPGCSTSDFTAGSSCSSSCIDGLITISDSVYTSCSSSAQDNQLLIANFLQGDGISVLCHNVVVVTLTPQSVTHTPVYSPPSSDLPASSAPATMEHSSQTPSHTPTPTSTSSTNVAGPSTSKKSTNILPSSTSTSASSAPTPPAPSGDPGPRAGSTSTAKTSPSSTIGADAGRASQCIEDEANPFDSCEYVGSGTGGLQQPGLACALVIIISLMCTVML